MKKLAFLSLFVAAVSLPSYADTQEEYNKALYAVGTQNWTVAVPALEKLSNEGNLDATTSLATLYLEGSGVKQDVAKAIQLLEQAAKKDNVLAEQTLAELYDDGEYVPRDIDKALYWYEKMGGGESYFPRVELYLEQKSYDKALKLLKEIEKWGEYRAYANYLLGTMSEQGLGVAQDDKQAFNYYKKAAAGYEIHAVMKTAEAYQQGKGTEKDLKQAKKYYSQALDIFPGTIEPEVKAFHEKAKAALSSLK